jgi:hypothetical protein
MRLFHVRRTPDIVLANNSDVTFATCLSLTESLTPNLSLLPVALHLGNKCDLMEHVRCVVVKARHELGPVSATCGLSSERGRTFRGRSKL